MHPKPLLTFLLLALAITFAVPSRAQTSADDQMGLSPYHLYNGGDTDSINLSNGMLNIKVPIASYPRCWQTSFVVRSFLQ